MNLNLKHKPGLLADFAVCLGLPKEWFSCPVPPFLRLFFAFSLWIGGEPGPFLLL